MAPRQIIISGLAADVHFHVRKWASGRVCGGFFGSFATLFAKTVSHNVSKTNIFEARHEVVATTIHCEPFVSVCSDCSCSVVSLRWLLRG